MQSKNKVSKIVYISVGILLAAALIFVLVGGAEQLFGGSPEVLDEVTISYSLTVTAQGQQLYSGTVTTAESSTLFDSMLRALSEEDIEVVYEESTYGAFITAIGGHSQDYETNLYWTFTLNGEPCYEGASTLVINDGDTVDFTLEELTW